MGGADRKSMSACSPTALVDFPGGSRSIVSRLFEEGGGVVRLVILMYLKAVDHRVDGMTVCRARPGGPKRG